MSNQAESSDSMAERKESWSTNEDEEDKKTEERCWSDVHEDMLSLKKNFLVLMEALALQGTHDRHSEEKQERPVYSRLPPSSQEYPWLMVSHGKFRERHTFFSLLKNHYYTRIIPELSHKYVWSSCCGWWVIQDCGTNDCFLLEPISMKKVLLPPLEIPVCDPKTKQDDDCDLCVLSAAPSDPNCFVLFSRTVEYAVFWCQPGDDNFIKQKLQDQQQLIAAVRTHGGHVYGFMIPNRMLVKITRVEKTLQFMQLMTLDQPPHGCIFHQYYLIHDQSCDRLLLVYKIFSASFMPAREVIDFKIFRLDPDSSTVAELKNIGDRAIFVDQRSAMSCVSAHENGGNRIYFTQFRSLNLYVYHLRDRSISLSLPCPVVSHRHTSIFNWVMVPVTEDDNSISKFV